MTSDLLKPAKEAFVWIWLPNEIEPVVAGRIDLVDGVHHFTYGRSYLARQNAIPIFLPDLPLEPGIHVPEAPHLIAPCLRDGSPDLWGRRVILNRLTGSKGAAIDVDALDEINYMLQSGSDRIGALDFQSSATEYVPRLSGEATLAQLLAAADLVEKGTPLPLELEEAIRHGTSIGGARPKAQLVDGDSKLIAKFSAAKDQHSVVKGEFIAMRLAAAAGLDVASVDITEVAGKDVLLITRFDRALSDTGWTRRAMVSALTILGLQEMQAHYSSYTDLAEKLRINAVEPDKTLRELFSRMVFNILVGNTDDHARNHAAFWDGKIMKLTPAYDIDPRPRRSFEANQSMGVFGANRQSRLALAFEAAKDFHLSQHDAEQIALRQVEVIQDQFDAIAKAVDLSETDRFAIGDSAMLQPYAFSGLQGRLGAMSERP